MPSGSSKAGAPGAPQTSERVSPVVPLIIAAAFFMEGLDTSIVNTSLPRMAESFAVTEARESYEPGDTMIIDVIGK